MQINPINIDLLTKLIEAYDNLAIVSTIDQSAGTIIIRGTVDTLPELDNILDHLPFDFKLLSHL